MSDNNISNESAGPGVNGLVFEEPLLFEIGGEGRIGYSLPDCDVEEADYKSELGELYRDEIDGFPEITENEAMRHYVRLSQWNYGVDSGFYPLGSCTMKYNPKINENMSRLPGFTQAHPAYPAEKVQGCLELLYKMEEILAEIAGMDATTLQPSAGAHGELTGLMLIHAYFKDRGEQRNVILVPDSAHGTNPASSALCGFKVRQLKSTDGRLAPETVKEAMSDDVAAVMITNPNTLGLFESGIEEIAKIVHDGGGLLYNDGANMNALMGISRPGDMGFDVIQYNLHKTFSTPHGGGGPGSGPVSVKAILEPYLPYPRISEKEGEYSWKKPSDKSIGKIKGFYGNFGVIVRAYTYIRELGPDNLRKATEMAVLNANYVRSRLKDTYHLPFEADSLHEVVFTDKNQSRQDVTTMDIAKCLLDKGFHAPTVYFPMIVRAAMMIEPTESESKQSCDQFIDSMLEIAEEIKENPDGFHEYPKKAFRSRLNEVQAARKPVLRWEPNKD